MAAVAEPTGLSLAGDVHPGNAADDPLYLPLYRRVRVMLDQTGLLYSGDCKMAALETRAEIAANQDYYLTRLPLTGAVQARFSGWVEAALSGDRDLLYRAALLDRNASGFLSIDQIRQMVDELIDYHGDNMPEGLRPQNRKAA